jgi:hypothetical protein
VFWVVLTFGSALASDCAFFIGEFRDRDDLTGTCADTCSLRLLVL